MNLEKIKLKKRVWEFVAITGVYHWRPALRRGHRRETALEDGDEESGGGRACGLQPGMLGCTVGLPTPSEEGARTSTPTAYHAAVGQTSRRVKN